MSAIHLAHAVQLQIVPSFKTGGTFIEDARTLNVERICQHVMAEKGEADTHLFAFPEFSLHGYTFGVGVQDWLRASISIPGPEVDTISRAAQAANAYVSFCTYELIPEFPGRFFNTNVVIAPNGDVIHVYRKLYAMTAKTRPGDVYDRWVDLFDEDSLFPVVETPFGKLGALIARDINWPEAARTLALKGAEVIINPLGAGRSTTGGETGADWIRPVRAHENLTYIVCANIGPFVGEDGDVNAAGRTKSEIVDYTGAIVARAETEGESVTSSILDIEALRAYRRQKNVNYLAQFQPHLHVDGLAKASLFPKNGWLDRPIESAVENEQVEQDVLARMSQAGVI